MDILTQGLLGGVIAQSVARETEKKSATLVGVFAGLLADADILIQSSSDPLLNVEYHRHFSHSLFFVPFGALLAFLILLPFLRRRIPLGRLYLFCLMGFSLSGVLDACTSYGTHLFWPFYTERVAWHIISIIDPVFTGALVFALLLGLRREGKAYVYAGLVFCCLYLLSGYFQMQRIEQMAKNLVESRGHQASRLVVKPTLGNLVLWRSIYIHEQRIFVDAIRAGLVGEPRIFEGTSIELFNLQRDLPELNSDSILYKDIQRFIRFSDGYVAYDKNRDQVLGDIRYSMLPVDVSPLWGIKMDTAQPDQHVKYQFFRQNNELIRSGFLNMLLNR